MQSAKSMRSRPLADTLMLIGVIACLSIALVRFGLVVVTVPYAAYVSRTKAPGSSKSIAERVADSGPWLSWWGKRNNPYREGGDYLGVMSHHKTSRNLGCVIGVLTAEDTARGVRIARVITPVNRTLLYGEESGNLMVRADGTTFRTGWAPISRDSAIFSDTKVVEEEYNPTLTAAQSEQLKALAGLTERSRDFYVGKPVAGGSGSWVLLAMLDARGRRSYALVPIESSPVAGVR